MACPHRKGQSANHRGDREHRHTQRPPHRLGQRAPETLPGPRPDWNRPLPKDGAEKEKHTWTDLRLITGTNTHPKALLRERGFRLGFVLRSARRVGSGLYHYASILYHLTTARRWRSGDTQRFGVLYGVLYSKFEFAVQDAIKTPKLKPRSRKRVLGRTPQVFVPGSQLVAEIRLY